MYLLSRFAKCLACALLISLMPAVAAGKGFRIAPSYPTGLYPDKVVAKDVNGDGKLDLVTLDYALISVLLGNGDGTFAPRIDYTAPVGSGFAAGDMNGDGKADLVITSFLDGTLNVMLGNGNGTFQSPIITSLQIPGLLDPMLGDVNKDGHLDVVIGLVGEHSNGGVLVALGKGDGTFSSQTSYAAGWHPTSVEASDLNADGKLDLAVVDQAGNLSILMGNGNGTFQKAVTIPLGYESLFVISGEFNGDGRTDLALTVFPFYGSDLLWSVAVFFGNGDGTFQPPTLYPTGAPVHDLTVADYDHNGTQDLGVISAGAGTMLNKGDGSFGQVHNYDALYPEALASGDLNGDGIPDLVTCSSGGSLVNVFLNFGDGTFPGAPNIYLTNAYSSQYVAGDFNRDGHPDLAISTFPLGVDIAISNPDGTFQAPISYGPVADHSEMTSLTAADLNNDGKLDLAASVGCSGCPGGGAGILLGNGDGTFQSPLSITGIDDATFVAAGDFNGDGKVDLAFADRTVRTVLGNGDGTFGAASDTGVGMLIVYMVAADFNHDGKLDLALADDYPQQGPALIVLLGKGDGTFLNPITYQVGTFADQLIAGDLNRDGNLDLVLAGDGVNVLLGNPDGTFQSPQQVTISTNTPLALADFNGDGRLDLAYVATDTGTLNLGYGNGDGTFQVPLVYPGIRGPLLATDFNGDHAPDLITGYSWFTPLMNSGGSTVTLTSLPNPSHFGQAVTFTATITPTLPYSPTPTGTVTFRDATTKLGTASLVAGVATFSYSGLSVGPHHISAIYSGDNNFNRNQKTITQRVKPH